MVTDVYGNCPDFQYQITECLTLIFSMSAIRSEKGRTANAKLQKFRQTLLNNDWIFYLYPLISTILAHSGYMTKYE